MRHHLKVLMYNINYYQDRQNDKFFDHINTLVKIPASQGDNGHLLAICPNNSLV